MDNIGLIELYIEFHKKKIIKTNKTEEFIREETMMQML